MAVSLTDYASQMAEAARARRMAEALQAQANAPIEMQNVNGNPVPISGYSVLAKMLAGYAGGRKERKADEQEAAAKKLAKTEFTDFMKNYEGTPEVRSDMKTVAASQPAPLAAPTAPVETINTSQPFVAAGTPPQKMAQALQSSMSKGAIIADPQRVYGNVAPEAAPEAAVLAQARTNTPQEKMAMLMQGMSSGNPYMEKVAPSMYEEARQEEKSGKIFKAIGDVSEEYGADPKIMAGLVAAGDSEKGISYLVDLGVARTTAKSAMDRLVYETAQRSEDKAADRVARAEDRQAARETQMAIAQMNVDTRRDIAAAVSAKGPKITEGQRKSASLAYRALEGNNRLNDLTKEGIYGPSTPYDSLFKRDKNGLTTMVLKSDQDRRYMQAFKEFIAPILRYDSGAAVPDSEVESYCRHMATNLKTAPKFAGKKLKAGRRLLKALSVLQRPLTRMLMAKPLSLRLWQ